MPCRLPTDDELRGAAIEGEWRVCTECGALDTRLKRDCYNCGTPLGKPTSTSTSINFNDDVWVRFTPEGVEARRAFHARYGVPPPTDPPGAWVKLHLWALMQEVGHAVRVGAPIVVEKNEIRLTEPSARVDQET